MLEVEKLEIRIEQKQFVSLGEGWHERINEQKIGPKNWRNENKHNNRFYFKTRALVRDLPRPLNSLG